MSALTQAQLNRMSCHSCAAGGEMYFHARCHPRSPSWCVYHPDGTISISCATCDKPVARVAVASTAQPMAHMDRVAALYIGRSLQAARIEGKLDEDFAEFACDISVARTKEIEAGIADMTLSEFMGICEVYGLNPPYLLQQAYRVRERKREKGDHSS